MKPESNELRLRDLSPERPNLRPGWPGLRPENLYLRPEWLDLRPERQDLRPERQDFRPERPDLRPEGLDEGGTHERTNERTNKSPPVFYRTSSPSGPLPKKRQNCGIFEKKKLIFPITLHIITFF